MIEAKQQIRVRFSETDGMGIVNHARYFEWFESARIYLLDTIGLPYKHLVDEGFHLPLMEANIRYLKSVFFGDDVIVYAAFNEKPRVRMTVDYRVFVGDTLVCTASTMHAFVNNDGRPIKTPESFKKVIQPYFDK